MLLHRVHWYLGQAEQVASELIAGTGEAVEDNRTTLGELAESLVSQRLAVAELRRVLARRLLDEHARMGRPA